jgi:hypothetical protein
LYAQWKQNNNTNEPNNPNNPQEIDGISVLGTSSGFVITLKTQNIPAGTAGIQYYISRPDYKKPIQIWIDVTQAASSPSLTYPFTEAGYEYTVKTQYTKSVGEGPFAKEIKVTPTGGLGEIYLRNTPAVSYTQSSKSINLYPRPDFKNLNFGGNPYVGLLLYLNDTKAPVFLAKSNNLNAEDLPLSLFQAGSAENWSGDGRPLSYYTDKSVFIEVGYYFPTVNDIVFKIVLGNTSVFTFPYLQ